MVIDPGVESGVSDTLVAPVENNYLWIRYRLPAQDLNAGRYILKLWVREPSTNREDERSIEIDLHASLAHFEAARLVGGNAKGLVRSLQSS